MKNYAKEFASKGGKARAKKLSKERRIEIATLAGKKGGRPKGSKGKVMKTLILAFGFVGLFVGAVSAQIDSYTDSNGVYHSSMKVGNTTLNYDTQNGPSTQLYTPTGNTDTNRGFEQYQETHPVPQTNLTPPVQSSEMVYKHDATGAIEGVFIQSGGTVYYVPMK